MKYKIKTYQTYIHTHISTKEPWYSIIFPIRFASCINISIRDVHDDTNDDDEENKCEVKIWVYMYEASKRYKFHVRTPILYYTKFSIHFATVYFVWGTDWDSLSFFLPSYTHTQQHKYTISLRYIYIFNTLIYLV